MAFNPGPEVAGNRGAEGATAHYSWKLAGVFGGTNREGYALEQALGTLEIDQLRMPHANSNIFTGSTPQMIKFQRRLGIAAGKIAHDSGELEGDVSVRYIGERLYDFADNPDSFLDEKSGDPLPFHRALGKFTLPFADMVEEDMVYHYFDVRPERVGLATSLIAPAADTLFGARKPTVPIEDLLLGRQDNDIANALAGIDSSSLSDQLRHAFYLYSERRMQDPETRQAVNAVMRVSQANETPITEAPLTEALQEGF